MRKKLLNEKIKALEEDVSDDFGEEMKYVKLKAEPCDKDQRITELEEQLAEKDKELKQLKLENKISFAVEQLEQLKKLCQEKFNWWENSEWEGDIYDKSDVSNAYFDIEANIEEQINELKERWKND